MKNVLIINAHQFYDGISSGDLNRAMVNAIADNLNRLGYNIKHTEIEKGYDIDDEVEKHLWADLIITQSPVYWFSTPWIYKKYVDEVFTAGMLQQRFLTGDGRTRQDPAKQYGSGGKLTGKKYMLSLTWNAPAAAFNDEAQRLFSGKSVDEIFAYNTANYKFCGVDILPSFSCFDVMKSPDITNDFLRLETHLNVVLTV
ncbi:NAD(P)H-dependent oxidoreductase [Winslowiella toletana]|uniref:NAD(P)H-dependent oxidoreductase n=1 Tax=Winslowiella toletana TaxID=92490 RepID=UPI0028BD49C0|nr:NAD(P)H-dependent oxidoreductase [Winslowiella toletana]WNN45920.1 NAD(P)H-dependent oxidoreductase [Winslowiella toletana]